METLLLKVSVLLYSCLFVLIFLSLPAWHLALCFLIIPHTLENVQQDRYNNPNRATFCKNNGKG